MSKNNVVKMINEMGKNQSKGKEMRVVRVVILGNQWSLHWQDDA